jgi:threonine dehydratase
VKAESLNKAGSFKYRGAYHRLRHLSDAERARGVVAFSSGNFAQGLACAAQEQRVACTIVMPHDAPEVKKAKTRGFGATVVESEPKPGENREVAANALAGRIAQQEGKVWLHPFNDFLVMAGQGTVGVEIASQAAAAGVSGAVDVVVPCGGGGLSSGTFLALASQMPDAQCWTVEPEGYDDTARSLQSGQIERVVDNSRRSACDALQAAAVGDKPFSVLGSLPTVRGGLAVSDEEVVAAMRGAFEYLKLVLEPSGATALAAVMAKKLPAIKRRAPGADGARTVIVVVSGGNVTLADFARHMGCKQSP